MSDRSAGKAATQKADAVVCATDPKLIRNVVFVGPQGAGKTTLVEQLLVAAGALEGAGSIELGSTVCDFDEFEIQQQKSASLSVASLRLGDVKVNLIDTPGYSEFVGELRAGLRAADAALFVVSATDGIDPATIMLWEECAGVGMPRAVVVTHLDKRRGDFDDIVAICQRVFAEEVVPIHLPLLADNYAVAGLMDLLSEKIHDYSTGERVIRDSDLEHGPLIETARNTLIETIIGESEDESLMDRYLTGEDLDLNGLVIDLETAVASGHVYPVVGSATTPAGFGARELLDLIARGLPSPYEHPLPYVYATNGDPVDVLTCDPDGPLCAEVIKTTTDPYAGRISLIRIFSGSLESGQPVHVSGHSTHHPAGHDADERIGTVHLPWGAHLVPASRAIAGDIVAVAKLSLAETADTLSSSLHPLRVDPWLVPEPLLPIAVVAQTPSDDEKLTSGLARLVAQDPTLRLELNDDTKQNVLWCMGEAHLALTLNRLSNRFGVQVDAVPVRVSLRETFAAGAVGHGRLAKQSGGHVQFAVCDIEVEPLPRGSGFEFVDRIVGGAIPRNYVQAVEHGIREQMQRGAAAGYPIVDVRVSLIDGKAHSVDSSDMAFQLAGALALKDAAHSAGISLLEPVDEVTITTSDEYVGALVSDITNRRGRITGTEATAGGQTSISALIPQVELTRYSIDVRSLTQGTAGYNRQFHDFEPMPRSLASRIAAEQSESS